MFKKFNISILYEKIENQFTYVVILKNKRKLINFRTENLDFKLN